MTTGPEPMMRTLEGLFTPDARPCCDAIVSASSAPREGAALLREQSSAAEMSGDEEASDEEGGDGDEKRRVGRHIGLDEHVGGGGVGDSCEGEADGVSRPLRDPVSGPSPAENAEA